jgi:hypothetical protein
MADHSIKERNRINLNNTSVLGNAKGYMDHLMKEATEIWLYPSNFNRDRGFIFNQAWYPVTNMLKQSRETPVEKQGKAKQELESAH